MNVLVLCLHQWRPTVRCLKLRTQVSLMSLAKRRRRMKVSGVWGNLVPNTWTADRRRASRTEFVSSQPILHWSWRNRAGDVRILRCWIARCCWDMPARIDEEWRALGWRLWTQCVPSQATSEDAVVQTVKLIVHAVIQSESKLSNHILYTLQRCQSRCRKPKQYRVTVVYSAEDQWHHWLLHDFISHYTSELSQPSQVEKANAVLLICDFMDSSESNITPRLCTVWAQCMDEEAIVGERCSWEILARLDLEPNHMNSVFDGLSCRQSDRWSEFTLLTQADRRDKTAGTSVTEQWS